MKGDTTRSTFRREKHYSGVRMQQGRVQLDADWNEQLDIATHRGQSENVDVIGECGAPYLPAGFHIVTDPDLLAENESALAGNQNPPALSSSADFLISAGRYYVDGVLAENDQISSYTSQQDLPSPVVVTTDGTYLVYLDVWSRHITALEDSDIRDVALGGPDTATRSKTIWQVKLHPLTVGDGTLCSDDFPSWDAVVTPPTGSLAAQAAVGTPSSEPCIVTPGAGYRRLENQHYRVEVHNSGALGAATFKWSRDNGAIVTRWESQDGDQLTVGTIGKDEVLAFLPGQWVELTDDTRELLGEPGTLVQVVQAEGRVLTVDPSTAIPSTAGSMDFATFSRNPKVRRWDMVELLAPGDTDWVDLEDGVQVRLTAGTYRTGDYWLIPARTATGDVEWSVDQATSLPAVEAPHGIEHHYCKIALAQFSGGEWADISDCRPIFPTLIQPSLVYVGGDGQEVMPDLTQPAMLTELARPLEVAVRRGSLPVAGALVTFELDPQVGQLRNDSGDTYTSVPVLTNEDGLAQCWWSLDSGTESPQTVAKLVLGDVSPDPKIHFTANLSVASEVAYDPGECDSLGGRKTVQGAIETLADLVSLYPVSAAHRSLIESETQTLEVFVASRCGSVAGVTVEFSVMSGGGTVVPRKRHDRCRWIGPV